MSRAEIARDLFGSRPGQWMDGLYLSTVLGRYAWRTRISDCRTRFNMTIENRLITLANGARRSEYRYVPREGM